MRLTQQIAAKILQGLRACLPRDVAAARAGVPRETLNNWLARGREAKSGMYRDFAAAVDRAEADAEAALVATIAKAAKEGDVKAATWLLERSRPERWVRQSVNAPRVNPQGAHGRGADRGTTTPVDPDDEFADLDNVTPLRGTG